MWLFMDLMLSRARVPQHEACHIPKLLLHLSRESQPQFGILS